MNPLLDTVEPDVLQSVNNGNGWVSVDFYSRPKVEALLAECQKQTLLEAVAMVANKITYGPLLGTDMAATIHDELRRMAEGERE